MRAYYFDNAPGDQRLAHDSGRVVPEATLHSVGVLHWRIPIDPSNEQAHLDRVNDVAREREYKNRDIIFVTKEGLGDAYEAKIRSFYEE